MNEIYVNLQLLHPVLDKGLILEVITPLFKNMQLRVPLAVVASFMQLLQILMLLRLNRYLGIRYFPCWAQILILRLRNLRLMVLYLQY